MRLVNRKLKFLKSGSAGFTLTELVVSVSIFATTLTVMLVLLNYTLKIQRETEAIRLASQGMRNFIEFLVKETRNGRIDYGVANGTSLAATKSPCPNPTTVGANTFGQSTNGSVDSGRAETRLPLYNLFDEQECIFWAKDDGAGGIDVVSATDIANCSITPATCVAKHLGLAKNNVSGYEKLNPPNMTVDYVRFYIRPLCDPYSTGCAGGLPETQPFINVVLRFNVTLGTGERVIIPYQTSISTDDYAIPRT